MKYAGYLVFVLPIVAILTLFQSSDAWLGEAIEQNEYGLVLKVLGDRDGESANQKFDSELVTAARGPNMFEFTAVMLKFPLGLQAYEFSERASFDSLSNEELVCDSVGGAVRFDVVVHMHIDESLPDIKDRLLAFTDAYQLRKYDGSDNVLVDLVTDRFQQVMRQPFINWCASKNTLSIMRNKEQVNAIALDFMNGEFNQYGLNFTMVSVTSAMRVSNDAQDRLNDIVTRAANTTAIETRNERLVPLQKDIEDITQRGLTEAQAKLDAANASDTALRAEADAYARTALVTLLGDENFMLWETTLKPLSAMIGGGGEITITPEDARIFLGNTQTQE